MAVFSLCGYCSLVREPNDRAPRSKVTRAGDRGNLVLLLLDVGVFADPGMHDDACRDARVDRARGAELRDGDRDVRRHSCVRAYTGPFLAEEQNTFARKLDFFQGNGTGNVVDRDDRQALGASPFDEGRNV